MKDIGKRDTVYTQLRIQRCSSLENPDCIDNVDITDHDKGYGKYFFELHHVYE